MQAKEKAPRVISDATLDRYLGAILALRWDIPIVRSVDVAAALGCSKACVSMVLKQMTREGLVRVERHGALVLSEDGERRARRQRDCWDYFRRLLVRSGVPDADAGREADALARAVSEASFEALARYLAENGVSLNE